MDPTVKPFLEYGILGVIVAVLYRLFASELAENRRQLSEVVKNDAAVIATNTEVMRQMMEKLTVIAEDIAEMREKKR